MNANYKSFEADSSFWPQLKSVANWSEHMVPLHFWNNTLFIMVTEPLDNTWSFPIKYILGTPEQLQFFWSKLNAHEEPPIIPAIEETVDVDKTSIIALAPENKSEVVIAQEEQAEESFDPDKTSIISLAPKSKEEKIAPPLKDEVAIEEPVEVPFDADKTAVAAITPNNEPPQVLLSDEVKETENSDALVDVKQVDSNSSIEGLDLTHVNLNSDSAPLSSKDNTDPFADLEKTITEGSAISDESDPMTSIMEDLNLSDDLPNSSLDPLSMNLESSAEQPAASLMSENTISMMPALSVTTESLRLENVEKTRAAEKQKPTQSASNSGNEIQQSSFQQINKSFKKSLALQLNNNELTVTHQDGSWEFNNPEPIKIQDTPCLFKFCLHSKLPFHGVVSEQDSAKLQLFKSLNISNYHEHITLLPVIDGPEVKHFILSISETDNLTALNQLQQLSNNSLLDIVS